MLLFRRMTTESRVQVSLRITYAAGGHAGVLGETPESTAWLEAHAGVRLLSHHIERARLMPYDPSGQTVTNLVETCADELIRAFPEVIFRVHGAMWDNAGNQVQVWEAHRPG